MTTAQTVSTEAVRLGLELVTSNQVMSGLQRPEIAVERTGDFLVASLRGYILSSDAGNVVSRTKDVVHAYTELSRPWWIPRFLWSRVPTQDAKWSECVHLSVTPKWTYPAANISVERLGPIAVERAIVSYE